ncbi:MAG: glycine cleavage T C-terminal barrel domain-containing protein, partial [Pseudomonadota bacterium]|nr:glycine cleavage T C-terminal barrel domain-containing protein [Pseudomonadota bacterium]
VGLRLDAEPLTGPNTTFWPVTDAAGETVGRVTSAVYSPRLEQNIALAFVSTACAGLGTELRVQRPQGDCHAEVVEKPFFDPRKAKAKGEN